MPFLYKLPTSMPTQLLLNTIHSCCLCITEIEKNEIHTALPAVVVVVVVAVAPV